MSSVVEGVCAAQVRLQILGEDLLVALVVQQGV